MATSNKSTKEVKIHYNNDCGYEGCPNCGGEMQSKFMLTACKHCGFISFGCDLCPVYHGNGGCYGKNCGAEHNKLPCDLYAVKTKQAFDKLPNEYKYELGKVKQHSTFVLLVGARLVPVYTEASVWGVTTIPVDLYEKALNGKEIKASDIKFDLGKISKIAELLTEEECGV